MADVKGSARAAPLVIDVCERQFSYLLPLLYCIVLHSRLLRIRLYQSRSFRRYRIARVEAPLPSVQRHVSRGVFPSRGGSRSLHRGSVPSELCVNKSLHPRESAYIPAVLLAIAFSSVYYNALDNFTRERLVHGLETPPFITRNIAGR